METSIALQRKLIGNFAQLAGTMSPDRRSDPVLGKRGDMMFLDEDDMTEVDSGIALMERGIRQQERIISELRRLGEPTQLAEKFLMRLRDTLETRRHYRDRMIVDVTEGRASMAYST